MSQDDKDFDDQLDQQSGKKRIRLWLIIGLIVAVVIAVPMLVLRQSETEATEPPDITQLEAEIDALYLTVYGNEETKGLETKLAEQAELISNIQVGDCTCPDTSGQFQNINNELVALRTGLDRVQDYSVNISQINSDIASWSADLTEVETALASLQAEVDALVVTDWTSVIDGVNADIVSLGNAVSVIQGQISSLESDMASLTTTLPRYAYVSSLGSKYLNIQIIGAGDYTVVVTVYGSLLFTGEVREVDLADYDIIDEMVYAGDRILTLFVEPYTSWSSSDTIILVVDEITGVIDYATATIGA